MVVTQDPYRSPTRLISCLQCSRPLEIGEGSVCDCQNAQCTAKTLARTKYSIRQLKVLFYRLTVQKCIIKRIFYNPKIPGLRCRQSRDSGLAKTAGIPGWESRGCNHWREYIITKLHTELLVFAESTAVKYTSNDGAVYTQQTHSN